MRRKRRQTQLNMINLNYDEKEERNLSQIEMTEARDSCNETRNRAFAS